MKHFFAVDPDDLTLEFLIGSNIFLKKVSKKYLWIDNGMHRANIEELDEIITRLLFDDSLKNENSKYGDVLNADGQKFTISIELFNLLESLPPKKQQEILKELYLAFK